MAEVYVALKNFLLAERSTTYVEFLVLEIESEAVTGRAQTKQLYQ